MTMSSKMILLFGVPMFVGGCAILWIYWDRLKKPPKKKIFISADCWLCVFDLLEPSQLGLGIAMISHRFDDYIDEHFKTRKWTLKFIRIHSKNGKDGTKQMEIINHYWKPLPIPQIQLPCKVIGFECIEIFFIDRNAIAFLHRFRQLFASNCPINLSINTENYHILDFILRNIWPMLGKNIYGMKLSVQFFRRLQHFVPSILDDCPLLRIIDAYYDGFFTNFPADDSAAASNGRAVVKWLFTPRQDDVPKVFKCWLQWDDGHLASSIEDFKREFTNASSPVNFIVVIRFRWSFASSVVPFVLTNELTREQLALKVIDNSHRFLFVRCPIGRDESKWTKWEEEAIDWEIYNQWNQIYISVSGEDQIGDGLLDTTPGPSDQQK